MASQEWTAAIGLRKAVLSLLWRGALTMLIWWACLWAFHAALGGIGVTRVPTLIVLFFAAAADTIGGFLLSRGLDEQAGFVGPVLTLMAAAFAAGAIIGGEALFAGLFQVATAHLRAVAVGATMIVACIWIIKHTWLDA